MNSARASLLAFFCVALAGCADIDRKANADHLAQAGGLTYSVADTGTFQLATYSRFLDKNQPIDIYIEGDGLAWVSRTQLSADPTPRHPLALALAARDSAANVVYLARPCQFTGAMTGACNSGYWSGKRFAAEVIDAMNQAIDQFVHQTHQQKINLIGYSGGAAIAALLAARRADVLSLRTVAGNLDHAALNRHHGVSAMPESLNPIDVASSLANLPQQHFIGEKDKVVPAFVAEEFIRHEGNSKCARITVVADAEHNSSWEEHWPRLLTKTLDCNVK